MNERQGRSDEKYEGEDRRDRGLEKQASGNYDTGGWYADFADAMKRIRGL